MNRLRLSVWAVRHAPVLLRTLRLRVHMHVTTRCACEFCSAWVALKGDSSPEFFPPKPAREPAP